MAKVAAVVLALVLALGAPAAADCLTASQNAIAVVQVLNAYSISRYTWEGDPQYDQVMPWCARTAVREFACNAAVNVAIREAENHALEHADARTRRFVCAANVFGAVIFGLYINHAISVQILGGKR